MVGKREIKVRLDGWCEGGLWQQKNDDGSCAKDRKCGALVHMSLNESGASIFCLALCSFSPICCAMVVIAWRWVG